MDLKINYQDVSRSSIGYSAYVFFKFNEKPLVEIIFTKGKIELEISSVERLVFNEWSINIFYKDRTTQYINLQNVTQIV